MTTEKETRLNEWFVPKFGPIKFRVFVGLLFLPYTGMCVSFAVIGSLLVEDVVWERVGAIGLIYALGLGISAHAADTIGSKAKKPWGDYFSRRQLFVLTGVSLAIAYAIGLYYIIFFVPLLAPIAVLEGFFLLAYNFELFKGRFHSDFWFAVSWGSLPLLAGYVMQTNSIDAFPLIVSAVTGFVSYIEIRLSRPYKDLRRKGLANDRVKRLEFGLKLLSTCTIAFGATYVCIKIIFS
jgi:hypothetical protein